MDLILLQTDRLRRLPGPAYRPYQKKLGAESSILHFLMNRGGEVIGYITIVPDLLNVFVIIELFLQCIEGKGIVKVCDLVPELWPVR